MHNTTTFFLFLDDICRLCDEVGWIFSLSASLKKLLSSGGWWCGFMQVTSTGNNIVMACVQKNEVQRRNSRRTWVPTIDFLISVKSRWIRAANLLTPILCNDWVSERRELVAVGHTTHTGQTKAGRWEKQFSWRSLSSSPCIWLCGCLTTQNHCALKGVAVILRRPSMPAATTTHCYSTEDQDFTFQATGLPVGDCLGQAGHVGTDKASSTLTSVGLPSCNGKYNQSPCACPTPSIPVQVTFGYWQFPISLLLIPKDLAGYIVPMFSSFSLLLCPNYKTVDEPQACGDEWCSLEWWHQYFLRRNEWDQGKINLFFQLGFLQSMHKGSPLLVQWLEESSKN